MDAIRPSGKPSGGASDQPPDRLCEDRSAMDAVLGAGGAMGALMRSHPWERTPLGPPESWPQSLTGPVGICLSSRFPMIIFWGPKLAQLYNDAYVPILGGKHPGSLGQPADECWREIWDVVGPMLHQVLDRGQATYSDDLHLVLRRSGYAEECCFTFSFSPIRDESGGVGGVFCAVTETTGRVVGERRLAVLSDLGERTMTATSAAEACAQAAAVFARHRDDVPFALLYLLDADGRTARLAAAAGLEPGGALSPATLLPDEGESTCWPLREAAEKGRVVTSCPPDQALARLARPGFDPPDTALVLPLEQAGADHPAGFLVAGVNSARPLDADCHTFLGLAANHISAALANATAFEAEHRRAEQLAELDRAKTMFFANLSHEFRTPLTLMLGPAEDLLGSVLREADRERVRTVHANALRLLKLVNTLLEFSRGEEGALPAEPRPVDLGALTAEVASLFQAAVERGGLSLVVDCPPLPRPVLVDPDLWEKVVLNLLSNAFKFTLRGEIRVRVDVAGDRARVTVGDTGVGIPAAELPRLFERFRRVAGTRARSGEGSGIGLALTRELVERHGGVIEVESVLGEGSTFTVLLPFAPDGQASGTAAGSGAHAAAFVQEALGWVPNDPAAAERAPEVLVVDDNADMRAHLVRLLSPHWRVAAVADGEAALRAVAQAPPELVLTDVMMPGLDGYGLLRALRADERTRTIPVIMVSARAGQEATVEGLESGADDYLIKPFTAAELVARVGTHLRALRRRVEATRRIRALAELGERLHASLDPDEIAGVLCEHLVPEYAAGCAVWLVPDDADAPGGPPPPPRRQAVRTTPDLPAPARTLLRTPPASGPARALLHGPPPPDPAGLLALPLRGRRGSVGVVTLAQPAAATADPQARAFLTALADRAALAFDNAAAYAREHRTALSLQRSLLPARLPDLDGLRLAARYEPGTSGRLVGGDWYDVIAMPGGRVALVIGDVVGKGVEAAALMGRLRAAVHAYALEGVRPARLLERLNVFVTQGGLRYFTTMLFAVYDPAERRLEIANAGHVPPMLVPSTGAVRLLEAHHGQALGVDPGFAYGGQTFVLPKGSTLLLYTDGLVETRDEPLTRRLDDLRAALAAGPGDAESVCDRALRVMTEHGARDDVALLALQIP
ncbi:SpoIIE family protein phosphatase [Nonomuraea sp. NPDC049607]|uniref:SpoIIE family protein phosphatase n=1 Tax=Nonomuraea sp. NPDC049607 TaxID=3154732 RepID=UPI0034478FA1